MYSTTPSTAPVRTSRTQVAASLSASSTANSIRCLPTACPASASACRNRSWNGASDREETGSMRHAIIPAVLDRSARAIRLGWNPSSATARRTRSRVSARTFSG